jgi:hypothetical protein
MSFGGDDVVDELDDDGLEAGSVGGNEWLGLRVGGVGHQAWVH